MLMCEKCSYRIIFLHVLFKPENKERIKEGGGETNLRRERK
jgi:hypothetical protein